MKPTKKVKPSRARYEASHRVVSARLDRELHEKLMVHQEATGESFGAFVRSALETDEARIRDRAEALAERRLGLQSQLRQLALELAEKERQLKAPVEEERARLMKGVEADVERERQRLMDGLKQEVQSRKESDELRLLDIEGQITSSQKELAGVKGEIMDARVQLVRLKVELATPERKLKELTEAATRRAQQQGVPSLFCMVFCQDHALAQGMRRTFTGVLEAYGLSTDKP